MVDDIEVRRLGLGDVALAARTFMVMAEVFDERGARLSDQYVEGLLRRSDFFAIVALSDQHVVGGLTAHALPMTRSESAELFIHDLAVIARYQRRGVGRRLIETVRNLAGAVGIDVAFVPADDDDAQAIDFYRAVGGAASSVTFFEFGGVGPAR